MECLEEVFGNGACAAGGEHALSDVGEEVCHVFFGVVLEGFNGGRLCAVKTYGLESECHGV